MTQPIDFKYAGRGYIAYGPEHPANDCSCIVVEDDPGVYEKFLQDIVNEGVCGFAASVPFSDLSCELLVTGSADFGEHRIVLPARNKVCLIVDLHNEARGMNLEGYDFDSAGREAGLIFYEKVAQHLYPVPGFFATRFAREQLQLDDTVKTWGYVEVRKQIRPAGLERQTYKELYTLVQHIASRLVSAGDSHPAFDEFRDDATCRATCTLDHRYSTKKSETNHVPVYRWDIAFRRQEFPLSDSPYLGMMFDIIEAGSNGIGIQDLYDRNCTKQRNLNAREVDVDASMEAIRGQNDEGDAPVRSHTIDPTELYNEEVRRINSFLKQLGLSAHPERYEKCTGTFSKEINGLISAQRGTTYRWAQDEALPREAIQDLDVVFASMLAALDPATTRVPEHLEKKVALFCAEAGTEWPMNDDKWVALQEALMADDFAFLRNLHDEIIRELSPLIGKIDVSDRAEWQLELLREEYRAKAAQTGKLLAGEKPSTRIYKKKRPNPAADSVRRWQQRVTVQAAKHSPDLVDYITDGEAFVKQSSRWFYRGAEHWTIER